MNSMPDQLALPALYVASPTEVRGLLAEARALLGPCTPLPALFEEVLRAWGGLYVGSARLRQAETVLRAIRAVDGLDVLATLLLDAGEEREIRLLAATLLASLPDDQCPPLPCLTDHADDPCLAMARFTRADAAWADPARYTAWDPSPAGLPQLLPLLAFLRGLYDERLAETPFRAYVLHAGVLHPGVAAHRPLHQLHRLLDYLGLSCRPYLRQRYHTLAADLWPHATSENWRCWQWVTRPGGPELLPQALRACAAGEHTLVRLYELKYAPLPNAEQLAAVLAEVTPEMGLLLCWLRTDLPLDKLALPGGAAAAGWLRASNVAAAARAYTAPPWWKPWLAVGLPCARQLLAWLQEVELPASTPGMLPQDRHDWLETHLLPRYRRLCANLLLAQAASGEGGEEIRRLAAGQDMAAIRALALLPSLDEQTLALLRQLLQRGGRPLQAAAREALEHWARRQGLPGADELERQHLLAAAWDLGPLAGERVRVGWQTGAYRLRLQLHAGKVELAGMGRRGLLTTLPPDLRHSAAYQEARDAQRAAQRQYRLFQQTLERYLLDARPLSGGEFRFLLTNPIFAHLAERLVWQTADGETLLWAGPERWETVAGEPYALLHAPAALTLTLAHPSALAHTRQLLAWQAIAADRRLQQPFKQLFREIYTADGEGGEQCTRFAGRRIDPRRAYPLLRAAGFAPGAGVARRAWPGGITAHLCWAAGTVSHDLFGPQRLAEVGTGDIWFTQAGATLPLAAVPPIIFSETLRAADLLTTRAAVGDADLTSRETIALRVALLREVARSVPLTNLAVREEGRYALVLGAHATYRVNLANGAVLLEPEGRQVVLPPHVPRWQPTERSDTTAKILGIVLTLAHDAEIDDLTFLAQFKDQPIMA
jgi:hypothetical protein